MSKVNLRLFAPKAFYFMFYAANATFVPYLVLYYSGVGLLASEIGMLMAIGPLITLVAAPVWGGVADYTHRHRLILLTAIAGTMLMVAAISQSSAFWALLPIVVVLACFSAPIIPLVDNSVLALLGSRRNEYGKHRMWGAIGWGIAGLTAGFAIDAYGHSVSFVGYLLLMSMGLVAAYRIPISEGGIGAAFWQGVRLLALNRRWLSFLIAVLLSGIGAGMAFQFLFLYLEELGASRTLMGWTLMVGTISEIPIFFYADRLLARWGTSGLLVASMTASAIRLLAYALMPNAWFALPLAAFHGMAFSAGWAAGVSYSYQLAPPGLGATAQGLFTGVSMGLGAAGGALMGGLLFDTVGPRATFMLAALAVCVGLTGFLVSENVYRRREASGLA